MPFEGNIYGLPGLEAQVSTEDKTITWGRDELVIRRGEAIDSTTTDAGNSPTTSLRHGLLLGKKTADGLLYPWDPTAADGTEYIYGVLAIDLNMALLGTAKDRFAGPVLIAGPVKGTQLLIPGQSSHGINGQNYEMLVRAQMTQGGRFILDDNIRGNAFMGFRRIIAKTADYTVVEADDGTLFTTLGAAAAVEFTLPAPRPGYWFAFLAAVDQNLKVSSAAVGQLMTYHDAAANSVSYESTQKIGGCVILLGISTTKWFVLQIGANTLTVTT